jgi:5-formyltetrahydrofolate cyclo-ligase
VIHNVQKDKKMLRKHYRSIRKEIGAIRRKEAAKELVEELHPKIERFLQVLSFYPFMDEIDTTLINERLLQEGRLVLPKIERGEIVAYVVTDMAKQMRDFGHNFLEPDPHLCLVADHLDCVLLPGIVFDKEGNRIGYGKGHYDQFMKLHPHLHYIAIGFREQLSPTRLPYDPHDQPYKELCLV